MRTMNTSYVRNGNNEQCVHRRIHCTQTWYFFHVQIHHTDYTKPRRIVRMTPNKLAVYFVADILWPIWFWPTWLWPILIFRVADMVFCCGRYGCGRCGLWPIWSHPSSLVFLGKCKFLLVFNSNCGSILYHIRVIWRWITGWPKTTGPACFIANILISPRPNCVEILPVLACLFTHYCLAWLRHTWRHSFIYFRSHQGLYILIDRPGSRHRHLAIRALYYTSSSVLL